MFSPRGRVVLDFGLIIYWTIITIGYIFFNGKINKFTISLAMLSTIGLFLHYLMDDTEEYYQDKLDKVRKERYGKKNN